MLLITNEAKATKIFKKYKKTVAFSLSKNAKGLTDEDGKIIANYDTLGFLPDEDTINALKSGDTKLKKVIKDVKKAIKSPTMDDAGISLGVAQLLTMLTANRKTPVVMVIIEDEEDPARNKILIKYIKAVLGIFGIEPIPMKTIKKSKLFKGKRKKVVEKVVRFQARVKGCRMSKNGADLKKLLPGEYLSAGIGRIADDDGLCSPAKALLYERGIKRIVGRDQRNIDRLRAGEDGVCAIVLIKRGEDDDLIPGITDGHDGSHHGFRAAAGDKHLGFRVNRQAGGCMKLLRQRLPQIRSTVGHGILMRAAVGN